MKFELTPTSVISHEQREGRQVEGEEGEEDKMVFGLAFFPLDTGLSPQETLFSIRLDFVLHCLAIPLPSSSS